MKKKLFLLWDRFCAWQNRGGLKAFFSIVTVKDALWGSVVVSLISGLLIIASIMTYNFRSAAIIAFLPIVFSLPVAFIYRKDDTMLALLFGVGFALLMWVLLLYTSGGTDIILDTLFSIYLVGFSFPAMWKIRRI